MSRMDASKALSRTRLWRASVGAMLLAVFFVIEIAAQQPITIRLDAKKDQYKRFHQVSLGYLFAGQDQEAIEHLESLLDKVPDDPDTLFLLAVANGKVGNLEEAETWGRKALDAGLPPEKFLTGALDFRAHLEQLSIFKEILEEHENEPVHGPTLGDITSARVRVWLRTALASSIVVEASESPSFDGDIIRAEGATKDGTDLSTTILIDGLKAEMRYSYRLMINGKHCESLDAQALTFKTLPEKKEGAKFKIAFGGCSGYVPWHERMWDNINSFAPDAFVTLGDNVYIDHPEVLPMQRFDYHRRQSRPEWRRLTSHVPVYAIWDDHDFGDNDCWGGPEIETPAWKRPAFNIFRENWPNPSFGGGDAQPGCYYDFYFHDIHFIMLDCRYYRTSPKAPPDNPTMLGPVQKAWFLETLRDSKGTFKVLCSSVPWVFEAKGDSPDTWNGYQDERNEIFDFLTENKIEGILLLSADRHRSDYWRIDREDDYTLPEFQSGRLTNQHTHESQAGSAFSYNETPSFGLLEFDTVSDVPSVTYNIIDIEGEEQYEVRVGLNELRN